MVFIATMESAHLGGQEQHQKHCPDTITLIQPIEPSSYGYFLPVRGFDDEIDLTSRSATRRFVDAPLCLVCNADLRVEGEMMDYISDAFLSSWTVQVPQWLQWLFGQPPRTKDLSVT